MPCDLSADPLGADAAVLQTTDALRADLLSPLLTGMLFLDLPARFVPFPIYWFDRAKFLEDALSRAWVQETGNPPLNDVPFYDVWQGAAGAVPALMLNTTNVGTGHRMVVSHLYSQGRERTCGRSLTSTRPLTSRSRRQPSSAPVFR